MTKPTIYCVTGNKGKWMIFQKTLGDICELIQSPLDTPEIQSMDVGKVAEFSAKWAAAELGKPVLKTDVGYYVDALNGFPGPFVKWTNKMISPVQILKLLENEPNRKITIKNALAYAAPNGESRVIVIEREGKIMTDVAQKHISWDTVFDHIVVEDGQDYRLCDKSFDFQIDFLADTYRVKYRDLVNFIN